MRILWLCNMVPGAVRRAMGTAGGDGLWVDSMLADLRGLEDTRVHLLCPGSGESGNLDDVVSYELFCEDAPEVYAPRLEAQFRNTLERFTPDVIHIWGTEFGHTLAMVHAAEKAGVLSRVVVSIQGLCSVCARHYVEGLPEQVCHRCSLRDALKGENLLGQRRKYALRGEMEIAALKKVRHVIGRTDWDRAATGQINPDRVYHFCNETLRPEFYQGTWKYAQCVRHHIFVSSYDVPLKGFHYLLQALPIILERYPDTTVSVPGPGVFPQSLQWKLRQQYFHRYLKKQILRLGLRDKVTFLGALDASRMKQAFLSANVFALPSTIENSPNSLGEAMLLGVPCVAAHVGGVAELLAPGEGYVYQSTAPYMLAEYILRIFDMQEGAQEMGLRARAHALATHDADRNRETLLEIYTQVAGGER